MRRIFTSTAPTIVTGIAGFIVLISFILGNLPGFAGLLSLRVILVNIAVIIVSVAIVMGFFHLLYVHTQRIRHGQSAFYSLILIITAIVVAVILIIDRGSPDQPLTRFVFDGLITPLQTSLGALLTVFLALAALRMFQRRRSVGAVWFLLAALIVLITQVPLAIFDGSVSSILGTVRTVLDALTTGGLRGLVLGVALGTVATAFRVLFFIDRPQSE